MKKHRYIYLGFDDQNNKVYFDQVTNEVYKAGINITHDYSKWSPLYASAIIITYAVYRNFKEPSNIFPLQIYILASIALGTLLAVISCICMKRANETFFSKCELYKIKEQSAWEKILGEGQKMIKTYNSIRMIMIGCAVLNIIMMTVQASLILFIFNIIIWWALIFFFVSISVGKMKKTIQEMQKSRL